VSSNGVVHASRVVLIGVDWGTSNLRVHQIDASGAILDSRRSACGILSVPANGFAQVLEDLGGDWLCELPAVPVVACGMVGARQGWVEVPYVQCPVSVDDLARALCPVALTDGRIVQLISGAAWRGDVDLADVIRGEESTIVGALRGALDEGLVCLPGTHVKWAWATKYFSITAFLAAWRSPTPHLMSALLLVVRRAPEDCCIICFRFVRCACSMS
jgi:2-dehydro-3-deoxygalactonokinase